MPTPETASASNQPKTSPIVAPSSPSKVFSINTSLNTYPRVLPSAINVPNSPTRSKTLMFTVLNTLNSTITGANVWLDGQTGIAQGLDAARIHATGLTLVTGNGTVGDSTRALAVDLSGDTASLDLRAGGDVYLREVAGDLRLGTVEADGQAVTLSTAALAARPQSVTLLPTPASGRPVRSTVSMSMLTRPTVRLLRPSTSTGVPVGQMRG